MLHLLPPTSNISYTTSEEVQINQDTPILASTQALGCSLIKAHVGIGGANRSIVYREEIFCRIAIQTVRTTKNVKAARSAFTVGTIIASKSFADMPRTIDCQLFTHSGKHLDNQDDEAALAEANFPKEFKPIVNGWDTMSSMQNALATLVGNPITVVRLIDLPAGGCTTATEGFVNSSPRTLW